MATRSTLSDLRNGIQDIYAQVMREQGEGVVSNAAILDRVRRTRAEDLRQLAPELLTIALTKLLNEVGNRRGKRRDVPAGIDLFGDYRVPRIVSIGRGRKKDTAKLGFAEAQLYLKAHSEKAAPDRHEPLRKLLEACNPYVKTPEDTLEILIERKRQAADLPGL